MRLKLEYELGQAYASPRTPLLGEFYEEIVIVVDF